MINRIDITIAEVDTSLQKKNSQQGINPGRKRERRKTAKDRRKLVNDGVIVTISGPKERRSGRDRRTSGYQERRSGRNRRIGS